MHEREKKWYEYYKDIKDDILNSNRTDENQYLNNVKALVGNLHRDISSSQLRNVFSRVKNLKTPKELYSLRPKLAYVYGRPNTKFGMQKIIEILDEIIVDVKSETQLKLFIDFFETIIAYHKYYEAGGKK